MYVSVCACVLYMSVFFYMCVCLYMCVCTCVSVCLSAHLACQPFILSVPLSGPADGEDDEMSPPRQLVLDTEQHGSIS